MVGNALFTVIGTEDCAGVYREVSVGVKVAESVCVPAGNE
jgi:hypothetical protein